MWAEISKANALGIKVMQGIFKKENKSIFQNNNYYQYSKGLLKNEGFKISDLNQASYVVLEDSNLGLVLKIRQW